MKEYIEREAALSDEMCEGISCQECPFLIHSVNGGCKVVKYINGIPAADVRPVVRGKWNRTDAYPHRLYCSVCYKTYLKNDELLERWEFPLNFCPNRGADMRGGDAE